MGCGASTSQQISPVTQQKDPNSVSSYFSCLKLLPILFTSTKLENTKFLTSCHIRSIDKSPLLGPIEGEGPTKLTRLKSHQSLMSTSTMNSNINSNGANGVDLSDVERYVMIFACTDTKNQLFEKIVTVEELFEIRETLDVNMTVGWFTFFRALKHCFLNHRVHLDFKSAPVTNDDTMASLSRQVSTTSVQSVVNAAASDASNHDTCNMTLELHLQSIGRTSIFLRLKKVENTTMHLSQFFLEPLYEFYVRPGDYDTAEKLERLERQVKLYREKVQILKEKNNEDKKEIKTDSSGNLQTYTSDLKQDEIPTQNIVQLLKDMQSKLNENSALSESEKVAFNSVIELLSHDNMYSFEYNQQAQKEVDKEIITWLKLRFGADSQQETDRTDVNPNSKKNLSLKDATDFLQSTNQINRSTTKQSIMRMFNKVDDWNFDVFTLEELTEGQTLFITSYTLFTKYDIMNKFKIDEKILVNFLREIESGYHPNPYHNAMHAADVVQVLHCIIYRGELGKIMSDEDIFAALLSAIIHDYDHPGLNNTFQVNSQSYLATLYNDRSVLENHHCAQAFELMKSSQYNILANLTPEQRKDVRETMIQMVLSTDMSQHVKYIGKFKQKVESRSDFSSKEDLRLALQIAVKMADISNPSRPQHLYLKWTERLSDEFYRQGDKEREVKITISPLMDRYKPSLAKGQIAFINYIITPMLEGFCQLLPKMKFALKYVNGNRIYWSTHDEIIHESAQSGNGEGVDDWND